jgi:hypothetical protein
MSIFTGTTELANVYVGTTEITSVYVGTNQVWSTVVADLGQLFGVDSTTDSLYEIDVDTLTVITSNGLGWTGTPVGCGGIIGRLFVSRQETDTFYEYDPDTLTSINSATPGSMLVYGIGGTATTLYANNDTGTVGTYVVNPDTLALGTRYNQFDAVPRGIGGTYDRLFGTGTDGSDTIYELNPSTGATIDSVTFTPSGFTDGNIRDIGGTNTRLFVSRIDLDTVYELDLDSLTVINTSSTGLGSSLNSLQSLGGIKVQI